VAQLLQFDEPEGAHAAQQTADPAQAPRGADELDVNGGAIN
jgi:hypothetical protein